MAVLDVADLVAIIGEAALAEPLVRLMEVVSICSSAAVATAEHLWPVDTACQKEANQLLLEVRKRVSRGGHPARKEKLRENLYREIRCSAAPVPAGITHTTRK